MSGFEKLPVEYFRIGYIAKVEPIEADKELIIMNKFGGDKPFLSVDEDWPANMSFICQFKHPTDHIFIQFFLNLNDMEDYIVRAVSTKKAHKLNPKKPEGIKILPIHKIVAWQKKKEMIDIYAIHEYYMNNISQFKEDFKEEIEFNDMDNFRSQAVYVFLSEAYIFSNLVPQCPLLKIHGVPYSEEDATREYLHEGMLMQIGGASEIKLPFKVGHVTVDNLAFIYEI